MGSLVRTLVLVPAIFWLAGCDCNSNNTPPSDADLGPTDGLADLTPDTGTGVAPGLLGRFSALTAHTSTLMVSAYEARYGDLVLVSAPVGSPAQTTVEPVDGVPQETQVAPGTYRDGITEPGDNVGQDTDIVAGATGDPMISHHDVTNRALRFSLRNDGKWSSHTVKAPADTVEVVGRYTAMALVDGKPAVAYLVLNIASTSSSGSFNAELRWAASSKTAPTSAGDWVITTIESSPMSCQNLCASDEACVVQQDGTSQCKKTSTGCTATCASTEACVGGSCVSVLPQVKYIDVPMASGLWPSVVVAGSVPLVVYYDRTTGNLKGARLESGTWTTAVIKGTAADNVGAFTSAVVDSGGTLHVAYQDATKLTLNYVQVDTTSLKPTVSEVIDDGMRINGPHPVGADSALVVDSAGKVRVVYQDALTSNLLAAMRDGPASWTPKTASDANLGRLLKGGARGYGFYSDLVLEGGTVYGSTFYFDQTLKTKGGLELFSVP